ncbi:hypothetical protein OG478_03600 [Streptomyces phaeochromogenes]|uniref:Rv1733c family protein n=1 Tax=Streptomyces phaeochromogenes TaxID=1923 RepID=UPI003862EF14|nr:hypothetical protein OG478_03600 [Streptomyces phaeochromogenes]
MATSRQATMRSWRWRRNPLRRHSDVIEAWVVLAGWILALVSGLWTGLGTANAVERAADQQRAERRTVSAVLAEGAEDKAPARAMSDHRVWATVHWTAPDGSMRTDEARVPPTTPAGSRVTVWIDRDGNHSAKPPTSGEAQLQAAFGGLLAAAGTGGAVLGFTWGARLGLDRWRMAQWAAEWERIDTRWGRRTG